jgi:hypothetical protein
VDQAYLLCVQQSFVVCPSPGSEMHLQPTVPGSGEPGEQIPSDFRVPLANRKKPDGSGFQVFVPL